MGTVLTTEEMREVRGEGIISSVTISLVKSTLTGVFGTSVVNKVSNFLGGAAHIPTISEYYREFGVSRTTAILAAIPWFLKPAIVR